MRKIVTTIVIIGWLCLSTPLNFGAQATFDPETNTWILGNGALHVVVRLTPEGTLLTQSIVDVTTGDQWPAAANQPMTPIRLQAGDEIFDARRQYALIEQYTQPTDPAGFRQVIVLQDLNRTAQITVIFNLYDNQPVLRYHIKYKNLTASPVTLTSVNMLPWTFADQGKRYTAMRVNQWATDARPENFETLQTAVDPGGTATEVFAGAHGQQCGWIALHDSEMRGIFGGWEFDGRTKTTVRHVAASGYVDFSSAVLDFNHPVQPGEVFTLPSAFLGFFHGDFDEAGYRTQKFVSAVLAKKMPEGTKGFPYVAWDSWGYEDRIDESTLRRNAEMAAAAGVELFIVDLGWARSVGDWYADPQKFPSGLGALGDYVHSLNMKFGIHFALTEADSNSPVLLANPDWTSTENSGYFGADSLCLSHQPVKDWLVEQAVRMIDEYHVDWILQDGENMVKQCNKRTHTHDPADSNYSNAVNGINAVVTAIQQLRPNVFWENCEDGGNMMTFNMVKSYVTSITSDAGGAASSRRAAFGATYPFPPRFAGRYMPQADGLTAYATHSYRFGGNWALMNRLPELSKDELGFLTQQVANYKNQRADISSGKVYHLAAPAANGIDAIESYNEGTDTAIVVITRAQSSSPSYILKPKGLDADTRYVVFFDFDPDTYSMPGSQLMTTGVRVSLPTPFSSDVGHIQPAQ